MFDLKVNDFAKILRYSYVDGCTKKIRFYKKKTFVLFVNRKQSVPQNNPARRECSRLFDTPIRPRRWVRSRCRFRGAFRGLGVGTALRRLRNHRRNSADDRGRLASAISLDNGHRLRIFFFRSVTALRIRVCRRARSYVDRSRKGLRLFERSIRPGSHAKANRRNLEEKRQ